MRVRKTGVEIAVNISRPWRVEGLDEMASSLMVV